MTSVNEKSMNFNNRVKVNFDGGDLTGDAGILLYKEFDDVIGLSRVIEENVHIKDGVSHRTHENHDVIMQKIYQNAAGYHADDHADSLKHDPALTMILNKSELASQPTMNGAELAEYCRKKGLYKEQVEVWKKTCITAHDRDLSQSKQLNHELKEERIKAKTLEKELQEKEKEKALVQDGSFE